MKKLLYSVFITSLLAVGVAHAEDTNVTSVVTSTGTATPVVTMMHIDDQMMRGAGEHMGSGTPGMLPPHMGSGTPPMMGTGTPMCVKFARSLSLGAKGDDVKQLQEMLRENGFLNASSTGYFGKMTKDAVVKFQKDGGLNPSGFFGELSRKQHEKRCGQPQGKQGGDKEGRGVMSSSTRPVMGSGTPGVMPLPCTTAGASSTGCEHSKAFPPFMGSGTPPMMGSGTPGMLPPPPHQ